MVDHHLLRAIKDELADLKRKNQDLVLENCHLWKVIRQLNKFSCKDRYRYSSNGIRNLMHEILSVSLEAVSSSNGSVLLFDQEKNQLVFVTVIGDRKTELAGYRIPADEGIAGWVSTHQKPALVPDVRQDRRWLSAVDQSIGFHTSGIIAVPLRSGRRNLGVIEVVNSLKDKPFSESDLEILQLMAHFTSFVIRMMEETLQEESARKIWQNLN